MLLLRPFCKRLLLKLCVFLLLGVVVNVAVAWGCAVVQPDPSTWKIGVGVSQLANGNTWSTTRIDRAGYVCFESFVSSSGDYFLGRWDEAQSVIESWCRVPDGREGWAHWIEEASGWPCVCLWSRFTLTDPLHYTLGFTARIYPRDIVEGGMKMSESVLPLTPIWPGFAINTIFYAALLWVLFCAPGKIRRLARIRRGRCPACGYQIAPGMGPQCSECGAELPEQCKSQPT